MTVRKSHVIVRRVFRKGAVKVILYIYQSFISDVHVSALNPLVTVTAPGS